MVAELVGAHKNRLVALRADYVDALLKLGAGLQAKRDDSALRDLRAEKSRFARDRAWELGKKDRLPAAAKPVFETFKKKSSGMTAEYEAARKRLDDFYRGYLEKLKRDFTKQNRIQEACAAKAAQEEIDGYKPPDTGRPHLAEGRGPKPLVTAAELIEHLTGTCWKLRWRAGSFPTRHKQTLTFHLGQIVRIGHDDGKVAKYKYEIKDDLSLRLQSRHDKTLAFDPSFTTFDYADSYARSHRRGILEAKSESGTAGEMWRDLVLHYPLDEVSETVRDAGPLGHHGKAEKTAVVFYGRKQNAYLFNGRNSSIRVDNAVHPDKYAALSISVWINLPRDVRDAVVFCWPEVAPSGKTYLYLYRGRFRCRFGSGSNDTVAELKQAYEPDTWHHVVMTHERAGGNVVYLDGKPVHSHPALPLKGSATHFYIGCRGTPEDNRPFRGLIDEFMVFKRALSPADVEALFHCVQAPRTAEASEAGQGGLE